MYQIKLKLGSGSTGDVYVVDYKGKFVAVKVMLNNYELEENYKKLHTYNDYSQSSIFIKPYDFMYFNYDPIDEEENLLDISSPTKDKRNAEIMIYFMEILEPIDLSKTTREKYILFIYKFIEQCKLLDVFDSDGFGAIMMRDNGDFVFYDMDGVYFGDDEGRDSVLNNLVLISPYPFYYPQYVYFDSRNIFDYEITKRFMELYNHDLKNIGIKLEDRVYSFEELESIMKENEELIEESNNLNLLDFLFHWQ